MLTYRSAVYEFWWYCCLCKAALSIWWACLCYFSWETAWGVELNSGPVWACPAPVLGSSGPLGEGWVHTLGSIGCSHCLCWHVCIAGVACLQHADCSQCHVRFICVLVRVQCAERGALAGRLTLSSKLSMQLKLHLSLDRRRQVPRPSCFWATTHQLLLEILLCLVQATHIVPINENIVTSLSSRNMSSQTAMYVCRRCA